MDHFELPIIYKGQELNLPARLAQWGYSYKIIVEVEGREINFEPDEERNFRAVLADPENHQTAPAADLLQAIAAALELHLR